MSAHRLLGIIVRRLKCLCGRHPLRGRVAQHGRLLGPFVLVLEEDLGDDHVASAQCLRFGVHKLHHSFVSRSQNGRHTALALAIAVLYAASRGLKKLLSINHEPKI